jgi:hypothetical protein
VHGSRGQLRGDRIGLQKIVIGVALAEGRFANLDDFVAVVAELRVNAAQLTPAIAKVWNISSLTCASESV